MSEPNDTREEVELPPFDERAEQTRDYWKNDKSGIGVVCVLQGELSCRDRQLKAALSVIERLNEKVANAEAFELLADAANREQKAEIERLKLICKEAKEWVYAVLVSEPEMKPDAAKRLLDDTYELLMDVWKEISLEKQRA